MERVLNAKLLIEVIDTINEHRQFWNQEYYHHATGSHSCGTSHCMAGFTECIVAKLPFDVNFDKYGDVPKDSVKIIQDLIIAYTEDDDFDEAALLSSPWSNWTEEVAIQALGLDDEQIDLFDSDNGFDTLVWLAVQYIEGASDWNITEAEFDQFKERYKEELC